MSRWVAMPEGQLASLIDAADASSASDAVQNDTQPDSTGVDDTRRRAAWPKK